MKSSWLKQTLPFPETFYAASWSLFGGVGRGVKTFSNVPHLKTTHNLELKPDIRMSINMNMRARMPGY
jgi:hypothetical protein